MTNDPSMSNSRKVRLGAKEIGRLSFRIHVARGGAYHLGGGYALDVDYIEVTP